MDATTLYLEQTKSTPEVQFDKVNGVFSMIGKSSPLSAKKFFEPIIKEVVDFLNEGKALTSNFNLNYFNTPTSRYLYVLMREFEAQNKLVEVNWYYEEEDEDMLETLEDFQQIFDVTLNIKINEFELAH